MERPAMVTMDEHGRHREPQQRRLNMSRASTSTKVKVYKTRIACIVLRVADQAIKALL